MVVAGVEDPEGHVTHGQRLGELEGQGRLLEPEALKPGDTRTDTTNERSPTDPPMRAALQTPPMREALQTPPMRAALQTHQ